MIDAAEFDASSGFSVFIYDCAPKLRHFHDCKTGDRFLWETHYHRQLIATDKICRRNELFGISTLKRRYFRLRMRKVQNIIQNSVNGLRLVQRPYIQMCTFNIGVITRHKRLVDVACQCSGMNIFRHKIPTKFPHSKRFTKFESFKLSLRPFHQSFDALIFIGQGNCFRRPRRRRCSTGSPIRCA